MIPKPHACALRRLGAAFTLFALASLAVAGPGAVWAGSKKSEDKSKGAKSDKDALSDQLEGKKPEDKIEMLNKLVTAGNPTKEVYFHLGNAKYEKGDAIGAAEAFEQAVAMDSTFFKAEVNLGLMYDEQQQFAKAIETFEHAGALQPSNPDVWSHMGNTYYSEKKYPDAMDLYRKALKLDPNAAHALYSMGVAFADAGVFREAVKYWKKVVEVDPKSEIGKNASENIQLLQKYLIP